MEPLENQATSFVEIVKILKRRKLLLLLCLVLALTPIVLYNQLTQPTYEATAIVAFEDFSKETMPGLDFAGSLSHGNFVANRIEEMKTKTFARQIYDELPDSARHLLRLPEPLPADFNAEQYQVEAIRRNLSVTLIKATDLVTITYTSASPELTKTVANGVTAVLQKSNLRVRRQEFTSMREFIDEQIRGVEERLRHAEDALRDFKTQENITSLEDESKEVLQRITQVEGLSNQIQADKDARQKRLTVIQQKLDEQKKDLAGSATQISSPLTAKLKEKLVELEVKYSGLQVQNYPETHPKMVELKTEIAQTKQKLVQTTMQILQGEKFKGVTDPISQLQKYLEETIALDVELQALGAQGAHLQKILDNYAGYLKKLPDKELTLVRLMRDKELNNKIYTRLLEEREQARIREAAEIGNIRIVESAELPRVTARPKKLLNIGIGLLAGTMLGLLLVFIAEFAKETPRTPEEVERILKLPVLASVPQLKRGFTLELNGKQPQHALVPHRTATSLTRDAYAYLWSSLQISNRASGQVIMITSAGQGEGKSSIAANLSLTAARHGKRTILIDGDLRKPILHEFFKIPISPGLTNLVAEANQAWPHTADYETTVTAGNRVAGNHVEEATNSNLTKWKRLSLREAIVSYMGNVLQTSASANLRILTKGDPILEPDILWASPMIQEILKILKQHADFIVIDTPPVISIPDAGLIAYYSDGIIFCVEAAQTDKTMLLRAQKILDHANSKFLGVVLNKVDPSSIYGSHKDYKYYTKHYTQA